MYIALKNLWNLSLRVIKQILHCSILLANRLVKWNNLIFHHVNIYFNFYTHRHLLFVYISYYMHWSQHNFFMWMLQSCICILQEMAFRVQICFVFILLRRLISFIKIIIVDFRLKTKSFIVCFTWSFQNNRKLEGSLDNFSLIPDFFFFF